MNHIWCSEAIWGSLGQYGASVAQMMCEYERVVERIVELSRPLQVRHRVRRVSGLAWLRRRDTSWRTRFSWLSALRLTEAQGVFVSNHYALLPSTAPPSGYQSPYMRQNRTVRYCGDQTVVIRACNRVTVNLSIPPTRWKPQEDSACHSENGGIVADGVTYSLCGILDFVANPDDL
jgi:hypothetical protein